MPLKNAANPVLTPVEHAKKRIRRYLRNHKEGLSTAQMKTWTDSVRRGGLIYFPDYQKALFEMRNAGEAVCTNDLWWLRNQPREPELLPRESDEPHDDGPLFAGVSRQNRYT
jgi:hypothetical protein